MDGATWYAVYDTGKKIVEDSSLPKKGLLALDIKRIREFGLESDIWKAHFSTNGAFFFNGAKVESALPDRKIKDFELVCHNKVVLENLAKDAFQQKYLIFGYKMKDEESVLVVPVNFIAYSLLRKRKKDNKWLYALNKTIITQNKYNFLLYF